MKVNVVSESAFTVQGHGVHTAFQETIAALKDYSDCEVVANSNDRSDIVHVHTIGPYSLAKVLFTSGAKVVSAHVTPDSFVGSLVGAKYWYGLSKMYLRWFYNRADAVLAVSREVADELHAMGVKKPVYLVPNTIKIELFEGNKEERAMARKKLGFEEHDFIVISVGQVQPRKRIDAFIDAARKLSEFKFVWVGGIPFKKFGADSDEMTHVMNEHPKNVRFTGVILREEAINYYLAADVFFLPSAQETFGLVVVEAAAAGLPIVLRDLQQYRDSFENGYIRADDESFVNEIEKLSKDHSYYEKWRKASENIAATYGSKKGAQRLMDVYSRVVAVKADKPKREAASNK